MQPVPQTCLLPHGSVHSVAQRPSPRMSGRTELDRRVHTKVALLECTQHQDLPAMLDVLPCLMENLSGSDQNDANAIH